MADPNLVTTCNFHGQEYLFKMNVLCNNLEILITDKSSGEEWQCSYDATYIENLTHKTGNFKQFEIFIAMLKSGLLRTSECVTLDLLTFEDLEMLRSRKLTKAVGSNANNRRYLIVTYVVEFDKIRYPLPLEYCGPPDPVILQGTIRRLEVELAKAREELAKKNSSNDARKIYFLQKRVDELTEENVQLQEEIRHLTKLASKKPKAQVLSLQRALSNFEKSVVSERNSHHELVEKLKQDKDQLAKELQKVKCSERCLKAKLNRVKTFDSKMGIGDHKKLSPRISYESMKTMYKRGRSPTCAEIRRDLSKDISKHCLNRRSKTAMRSLSRDSSTSSTKYGDAELTDFPIKSLRSRTPSPVPRRTKSRHTSRGDSSCDSKCSSRASSRGSKMRRKRRNDPNYKKLEEKIDYLQKMLKDNVLCEREK